MPWRMEVKRALISLSDKTGLEAFAPGLAALGVEIVSTGGTAKMMRERGIPVTEISDYTGFPEMMDGRVKTLHPKVHGGLLYVRGNAEHERQAAEHGIVPIDLVAVNLYPFESVSRRPGASFADCIENIDIGGPSMLRSAAKNHASVTVVCDPADYPEVLRQLQEHGATTPELRRRLAAKVFRTTGHYDSLIAKYLAAASGDAEPLPDAFALPLRKAQALRYGENPHQKAALYGPFSDRFEQLHGKELSYNNILDLTAAYDLIQEFQAPTVAILKHTNPCGVGSAPRLRDAWDKAFATDRQAPFGGIIAVNRPLDGDCADAIAEIFSEVIIAPDFGPAALERLRAKKNLRLLKYDTSAAAGDGLQIRSVTGGVLVQERDAAVASMEHWRPVTRRRPTDEELEAMWLGWRVVKHVKSNAIVYAARDRTLGIGAGQMSRVDSSKIAIWKAGEAGLSLKGSVVASDAFFPFPDGPIAAAEAGATAIIQPGGSVKDNEVIAACDERNVAMVFTGMRHFRH